MKAQIKADRSKKGGGYAILELEEISPVSGEEHLLDLSIQSDGRSLGLNGWQVALARIRPENVLVDGAITRVFLGPCVVDYMQSQAYRLEVFYPDGTSHTCGLSWRNIPHSAGNSETVIRGMDDIDPIVQESKQAPVDPASVVDDLPKEPIETSLEKIASKKKLVVSGVIVFLVLVAAIGWFKTPTDGLEPVEEPSVSTPVPPSSPPPSKLVTPKEQAQTLMKQGKSAEDAVSLAKELLAQPNGTDAALLLLEFAAEKGHGEALYLAATYYDPEEPALGAVLKNPVEAFNLYKSAAVEQYPGARERLDRLQTWAKRESARNADAQKLLELWR